MAIVADLQGKSMHQRAEALIGLAYPDFCDMQVNSL